jgi:beta-lactamase regulating signal transducer with metallopeptidase domain
MNEFLSVSLSTGVIILIFFLLLKTPFIRNRYSAKWRMLLWLVIAVRLLIPFNMPLPFSQGQQIQIPLPEVSFTISEQRVGPGQSTDHNQAAGQSAQIEQSAPAETSILSEQSILAEQSNLTEQSAPTVVTKTIDLQSVLLIAWGTGAIAFLLYHSFVYMAFIYSLRRYRIRYENPLLSEIVHEMHINRNINFYISRSVNSPIMIGLFRPSVILPPNNYEEDVLRVIIKHELTHFKRKDLIYKLIFLATNAVHWFNPMVYALCYQANSDLELACDDAVVKNQNASYRKAYSFAILDAIKNQLGVAVSTNFKGGKKAMKERFKNILDTKPRKRGIIVFAILFAVIVTASLVVISVETGVFDGMINASEEKTDTKTSVQSLKTETYYREYFLNNFEQFEWIASYIYPTRRVELLDNDLFLLESGIHLYLKIAETTNTRIQQYYDARGELFVNVSLQEINDVLKKYYNRDIDSKKLEKHPENGYFEDGKFFAYDQTTGYITYWLGKSSREYEIFIQAELKRQVLIDDHISADFDLHYYTVLPDQTQQMNSIIRVNMKLKEIEDILQMDSIIILAEIE